MADLESLAIERRLKATLPEPGAPRAGHKAELKARLLGEVKAPDADPIRYTIIQLAPLGQIYLGYTDRGICFLTGAVADEAEFAAQVAQRYGAPILRDDSRQARWQKALERWLEGAAPGAPVDLSRLTPFEQKVLQKASEIHRGAVRPYQWLAREVGSPGANRAVGNVMARNPVPLLVPCHRVVAASGQIGNYSMGGPAIKRRLLELEGVDVERLAALARQGFRYKASRTTGIYCYPTCRAIQPQHERLFKSPAEAEGAGFRACKVCRPG
jgi:O-6-methylguanine DNA methyltransferase